MRNLIPYNPKLKKLARKLRKNSTKSEILLWKVLRKKKIKGYRFVRQKPLLDYIVDFYCPELKLAIEIDGSTHKEKVKEDKKRQERLEKWGVSFVRIKDENVKGNVDGAVKVIKKWIDANE